MNVKRCYYLVGLAWTSVMSNKLTLDSDTHSIQYATKILRKAEAKIE